MNKLATLLFAFVLALSLSAVAQTSNTDQNNSQNTANQTSDKDQNQDKNAKKIEKAERKEMKASEKGKSMRLTGWVKSEDGKTVFVNDKDKQTWSVSNPDAVSAHEGHHVKVKAKLNEADHSMTIAKVTMMRKGKQSKEVQQQEK